MLSAFNCVKVNCEARWQFKQRDQSLYYRSNEFPMVHWHTIPPCLPNARLNPPLPI